MRVVNTSSLGLGVLKIQYLHRKTISDYFLQYKNWLFWLRAQDLVTVIQLEVMQSYKKHIRYVIVLLILEVAKLDICFE